MVGVFTADLEFLSRFLGHQAKNAKFYLEKVFLSKGVHTICVFKRTVAMLKEDGQRYEEMMGKNIESKRDKQRAETTKGHTHSTVAVPMADLYEPNESCPPVTVHVILGMTPWIVRAKRKSYIGSSKSWRQSQGVPAQHHLYSMRR